MTDRIITRKEFRELTGLSRTSEWRKQQEGLLPPIVALNNKILGYRMSDYNEWLDNNTH